MTTEDMERTAGYWDAYVDRHIVDGQNTNRAEWLSHPIVQDHHRQARGNRSIEAWVAEVGLDGRSRSRGVGIGAGTGSLELGLVQAEVVEQFDLLDVSPGALEVADRTSQDLGVADRVTTVECDVSTVDLGTDRYDVASFMGSLHHVSELDTVVRSVARSLTPDGALVAYEYVGPDRFATGPVERELSRRLYRALDPRLRAPLDELPLPDPAAVIAADPTEAVHSSEILAVLGRHFDEVSVVHHGGALAYTLWWGLNHDALHDTTVGREFVDTLLTMDASLTASGVLADYFVTIRANGPRPAPS